MWVTKIGFVCKSCWLSNSRAFPINPHAWIKQHQMFLNDLSQPLNHRRPTYSFLPTCGLPGEVIDLHPLPFQCGWQGFWQQYGDFLVVTISLFLFYVVRNAPPLSWWTCSPNSSAHVQGLVYRCVCNKHEHRKGPQTRQSVIAIESDPHFGEVNGYLEQCIPEPVAVLGRRQREDLLPLFKGKERFGAWSINTAEDSENRQYPSNAA